jgi:hypothetical protein
MFSGNRFLTKSIKVSTVEMFLAGWSDTPDNSTPSPEIQKWQKFSKKFLNFEILLCLKRLDNKKVAVF